MSEEPYYGVFFQDQGVWEYLAAVEHDDERAHEEASRLDELAFEKAQEDGEEAHWDDYNGMHYVEPISTELAEYASSMLERGFAVRVS
jgi:hypothetical protein